MTGIPRDNTNAARTELFDAKWYLEQYPDVKALGMDPFEHYLWLGRRLGRSPSPNFGAAPGGLRTISWNRKQAPRAKNKGVTVITPTGDRLAAFNKCVQWVTSQTVHPDQWIIVDDGFMPLDEIFQFPSWVKYIKRKRKSDDASHTLCENLLAALDHIAYDNIFIMEDDDWYSKHYIEFLLPFLQNNDLVGVNLITYYHLTGRTWKTGKPKSHTALAQTAFTPRAIPSLRKICESGHWEIRERGIVDRHWWHSFPGSKLLIQNHPRLHVGFKGLFGRAGRAEGHDATSWGYKEDTDFSFLKVAVGNDLPFYREWSRKPQKPFVIYTAIAGDFDVLREPLHRNPLFDFVVFSDQPQQSDVWRWIPFDQIEADAARTAKKPKQLPHILLPQYEWSIWIDANIFITGSMEEYLLACIESGQAVAQFEHPQRNTIFDEANVCIESKLDEPDVISGQIERYRREGFTENATKLYECNLIIRQHNNPKCIKAMNRWWKEVQRGSKRDQISYPYALWKEGLEVHSLAPKGTSVRNVDNLYYSRHGKIDPAAYLERINQHIHKLQRSRHQPPFGLQAARIK